MPMTARTPPRTAKVAMAQSAVSAAAQITLRARRRDLARAVVRRGQGPEAREKNDRGGREPHRGLIVPGRALGRHEGKLAEEHMRDAPVGIGAEGDLQVLQQHFHRLLRWDQLDRILPESAHHQVAVP